MGPFYGGAFPDNGVGSQNRKHYDLFPSLLKIFSYRVANISFSAAMRSRRRLHLLGGEASRPLRAAPRSSHSPFICERSSGSCQPGAAHEWVSRARSEPAPAGISPSHWSGSQAVG